MISIIFTILKRKYHVHTRTASYIFLLSSLCIGHSALDAQNKRMRKKKTTYFDATSQKTPEKLSYELTYEELKEKKNRYLQLGDREGAVKIVEQMLRLCSDMTVLADLILELGDLLYEDSHFENALTTYKNFMQHYEGHTRFEYALFRAIQCSSRLVLHFDRDQTKTEETIGLAEKYLAQDNCITYKQEVERIKEDCLSHLFTSELYTIEFYAKTGKVEVAQKRLSHIKDQSLFKNLKNYQDEIKRLESTYSFLEHYTVTQTTPNSETAQTNETIASYTIVPSNTDSATHETKPL